MKNKIFKILLLSVLIISSAKAQNDLIMDATGKPLINQAYSRPTVSNTGSYTDLLNLPTIIQGTKGTATISGVSLQTAYVITHGLSYTPSQVYIQSTTLAGAALNYITAINGTTFTVNFAIAPSIGTNNIMFYWTAYK